MSAIEYSDAHPEYLDDDSLKSTTTPLAGSGSGKTIHADSAKASDEKVAAGQDWILKIGLFGFGIVFVMWMVSRRRRNAYDALKQDEKWNA